MEGIDQYERSYKELVRVSSTLSNDNAFIDFSKLDENSKRILRDSIKNAISPRMNQLNNIISGNHP
jgi:hypothetical protein